MLERLASYCHRHRWWVLLIWLLTIPAAVALSSTANFSTAQGGGADSESSRAADILVKEFPTAKADSRGETGEIVFQVKGGLASKQAEITTWLGQVAQDPIVDKVSSPFDPQRGQISPDGSVGVAKVNFKPGVDLATKPVASIIPLADSLRSQGVTTEFGGQPFAGFKLPPSEAFGLLAAVIILILAFGSVIAMGLPILTAILGVFFAIGLVGFASKFLSMQSFVTSITGMIGLGVGIDYVLFIVTRYKDELIGSNPHDATVRAIGTAGRAVVFAGTTVIISMLGMFLMGLSFINGIAIAGALPVFVIVLATMTLIPAMLGFIGHNLSAPLLPIILKALRVNPTTADKVRIPLRRHKAVVEGKETGWHRWSRTVQRRAWPFTIIGLVLLVITAIPLFSIRLGFSDQGNNAKETTTRKAYDIKSGAFGIGSNAPGLIVVQTSTDQAKAAVPTLEAAVKATPNVAFAQAVPLPSGTAFLINYVPKSGPQDVATADLVHTLRKQVIPAALGTSGATALLGGFTAGGIDFAAVLGGRMPLFIGTVLLLSFILLMAVFRSILVPLKAVIMNLLSIGAAYGLVVAVFQWGWGASRIGIGRPGPIEPWIPMMLFAIVFGLSMDYEVFLLSRIREHYDHSHNNSEAVVEGLASTARVITAAAAIMVCVFLGFVLGERPIKMMGIGLAAAVFIDATVVRIVMVPATMELLGDRNWWFPKWLDRIIPKLNVEGDAPIAELQPTPELVDATID